MNARSLTLRVAILQSLSECGDYLLPEQSLATQVMLRVKPPPLDSEIAAAIRELDSGRNLIAVREADGYRYGLSANGKALLIRLLS